MTRSRELGLVVWERFDDRNIENNHVIDQIERDEADIVTPFDYACYHGRGRVAVCAPGSQYVPQYWFSRFPQEISPAWNLVNLFTPTLWMFTFLSILSVSIFLIVSATIGSSYFGLQTFREKIILSPFRLILTII